MAPIAGAAPRPGAGAGSGIPAWGRKQKSPVRLELPQGTCRSPDWRLTATRTCLKTSSTLSPGRRRASSRAWVYRPFWPAPSLAVLPGAVAKATKLPVGASICVRPRAPERQPLAKGLLRHASRTRTPSPHPGRHSTVTLLARLRGWSTSQPRMTAMW